MAELTQPEAGAARRSLIEIGVIDDRDAARLAACGLIGISLVGLVGCAVAWVHRPGLDRFHPVPIVVLAAACLLFGLAIGTRPSLVDRRRLPAFLVPSATLLGVLCLLAGPAQFPFVAVFYVWFAAIFPLFRLGTAVAALAYSALVIATVLVLQPGHWDAVAEWELAFGTALVTAGIVEWLVQRITTVAMEHRRTRQRLEQASERLQDVNRQKRQFLAATSHELRTPLNAIVGFADLLGEELYGPLNERQADYIEDIRSSGHHLLHLIDDVLDLGKVESGQLELDFSRVDLAESVRNAVALFREESIDRGIEVQASATGPATVEGDERKLLQVIVNLVANAVTFTPSGGRIDVGARANGGMVEVWVTDTGPGIPIEHQGRIFEAYEQGERREGGTGLGLPLAKRLVEAHGGALTMESRPGRGSTFRFVVPRRPSIPRTANEEPAPLPVTDDVGAFQQNARGVALYVALLALLMALGGRAFGTATAGAWTSGAVGLSLIVPWRRALPLLVLLAAAYGFVLATQSGNPLPFVRWELVAGAGAGAAAITIWLRSKLDGLTTAEMQARTEVEHSWRELGRVSHHKSEFLANTSHELRTPLTAVIGFADALHEQVFGPLNGKQLEYLADIADAGRQLLTLINDILDLAKAEAGRIELTISDVDVELLIDDAIALFRSEAAARRLSFAIDIDPTFPVVRADSAHLGRALANVVSNAVKFSPDGGRIGVESRRRGDDLIVAVTDSGPGIALGDQPRIFDQFQQGSSVDLAAPGAGLGLTLARTFAELHDGRLEVESRPGQGSVFRLVVPQHFVTAEVAS